MYYVAVLAPDDRIVQAAGGSLPFALQRFRDAWNDHWDQFRPEPMQHIPTNVDFDVGQFQKTFCRAEHHYVITTNKAVLECFTDVAAAHAHGQ